MMTAKNIRNALETMGYGLFFTAGVWTAYRFADEAISVSDRDLDNVYHGAIKLGRA